MKSPAHLLANYLGSLGVGTPGADIFVGKEPEAAGTIATIYDTGGRDPLHGVWADPDGAVYRPTVQLRVRADSYEDAYARADELSAAILRLKDAWSESATIGDNIHTDTLLDTFARGDRIPLGADKNNRQIVTQNFECIVTRRTVIPNADTLLAAIALAQMMEEPFWTPATFAPLQDEIAAAQALAANNPSSEDVIAAMGRLRHRCALLEREGSYAINRPPFNSTLFIQLSGWTPGQPEQCQELDGYDWGRSVYQAIKTAGKYLICYFSAGSWEEWRPDNIWWPTNVKLAPMGEWPGEWWVDVREVADMREVLTFRANLAVQNGADAIDWDNIDIFSNQPGIDAGITSAQQHTYNTMLADVAHSRGLAAVHKNISLAVEDEPFFDACVCEQPYQYNEVSALAPFYSNNKPCWVIEYDTTKPLQCEDAQSRHIYLALYPPFLDGLPIQECAVACQSCLGKWTGDIAASLGWLPLNTFDACGHQLGITDPAAGTLYGYGSASAIPITWPASECRIFQADLIEWLTMSGSSMVTDQPVTIGLEFGTLLWFVSLVEQPDGAHRINITLFDLVAYQTVEYVHVFYSLTRVDKIAVGVCGDGRLIAILDGNYYTITTKETSPVKLVAFTDANILSGTPSGTARTNVITDAADMTIAIPDMSADGITTVADFCGVPL